MIMFNCDYNEGCCQEIMDEMIRTNMEQHEGYSEDEITAEAKTLVKKACEREDVDVHIMVGGTQTNLTVIATALYAFYAGFTAVAVFLPDHVLYPDASVITVYAADTVCPAAGTVKC